MKNIILILTISMLAIGCQRGKLNELSVDFNKSLIIPPTNDLPAPGSKTIREEKKINTLVAGENNESISNDNLVNNILTKTNSDKVSNDIRDQIDYDTGYKSEEGFFSWLLKGKSEREKNKTSSDTVDAFEEQSNLNTN